MAAPVMTRHEGVQALGPSRRGLRLADGHQSKPAQQLAFGDLVCFYGDLEKCKKTPMLFLYGIQARPGKEGCGTSCSTESDFAKSLKPFQVATAVVYIQTGWEGEELVGSTFLVDPTKLASWPAVDTAATRCARSPPMQPVKPVPPSRRPVWRHTCIQGCWRQPFQGVHGEESAVRHQERKWRAYILFLQHPNDLHQDDWLFRAMDQDGSRLCAADSHAHPQRTVTRAVDPLVTVDPTPSLCVRGSP